MVQYFNNSIFVLLKNKKLELTVGISTQFIRLVNSKS